MSRGSLFVPLLVIASFAVAGCVEADPAGPEEKELAGTPKGPPPAGNATAEVLRSDEQSFEGTIAAGTQDPASGMTGCGDVGQDGVDQMAFDWVIVDKEADGTASVVRSATIKLEGTTPTTLDIDLFVVAPDGTNVASATSGNPAETIDLKTSLKAGTYTLLVTACNLAAIQFTLDARADYYAV